MDVALVVSSAGEFEVMRRKNEWKMDIRGIINGRQLVQDFAVAEVRKARAKPVPRGILATDLQITERKLLYTFRSLLLGFNVTFDKCHLNTGF